MQCTIIQTMIHGASRVGYMNHSISRGGKTEVKKSSTRRIHLIYGCCGIVIALLLATLFIIKGRTVYQESEDQYITGHEDFHTAVKTLMPSLEALPEETAVHVTYRYESHLIERSEYMCLHLTFTQNDFIEYMGATGEGKGNGVGDPGTEPLRGYMLPRSDDETESAFYIGNYRFDFRNIVETQIRSKYYVRMLGVDEEKHSLVYLLVCDDAGASIEVDGLLRLHFRPETSMLIK